jgi:hypothetical protein
MSTRRLRAGAPMLAALAVLSVAACGSTTPPPPSVAAPSPSSNPAASPSPAPSPTAVDASQAFLSKIKGHFTGKATISGELKVSGALFPVTGTADVRGADSHTTISVDIPGQATTQESQTISGLSFVKSGSGPWFAAPAKASSDSFSTSFQALNTIKDVGVETKNGQSLHHLTPSGGSLPAAALGLTSPTISNATGTMEFYAKEDGTLVVMSIAASWTQVAGSTSVPASMTVDFTFSCVACEVTISSPTPVFKQYTSRINHYTVAVPDDWDFHPAKKAGKFDYYESPSFLFADGGGGSTRGFSLNELAKGFIAYSKTTASGYKSFKLESNTAATLGGLKARRITFHATAGSTKAYFIVVVAVKGAYWYELDLGDVRGHEATNGTLFDHILSTYKLT